jgi:hypothetical protein
VRASIGIPPNILGCILNLNPLIFQIFDAFLEIFSGAAQLQHHDTFFARQYLGVKNIECQIIVLGQMADQGTLNFCLGKTEYKNFGIHGSSSKKSHSHQRDDVLM